MPIETGQQVTHRLTRRRDWRKWFQICERLHSAVINFYAENSDKIDDAPEERVIMDNVPLHEGTAVGSKVMSDYLTNQHQILLDIDIPHVYVPSTTDGHGHLIFRKQLPLNKYLQLLDTLADIGIIEPGFASAARNRGEAWLRTPWTPKDHKAVAISDGKGGVGSWKTM